MKIYIRILLPAIAVVIHIHELNSSSGHNEDGSSWPQWFPQQAETSQRRQSETPSQQLQNPQQTPQGPYQRHTLLFREPQLEQELHEQQSIHSETPRHQQIQRTPRKRQQQQSQQQPRVQHEPHPLQRQQQQLQHETHPLQSATPRNRQRERSPPQLDLHRIYALQLRRQEIEEELIQLLQPIQSETPQSRQRQRPPQQQEQPHLGQESNQLNSPHLQQQIEQEPPRPLQPIHDPYERQRQQDQHQVQLQYPFANIRFIDPPTIIDCFDKKIKASVAIIDDVITTFACELIADPPFIPFIPDITYRKNNIYATVDCGINDKVRCIAYVDERAKVFGVKPPPHPNERLRKGNPAKLNPTPSTSFITRKNQVFEVTQNPQSKIVEAIRFLPENRLMSQNNGNNNVVSNRDVVCCGMRFAGHRTDNGHIVGASLVANARPQFLYNPNYMPTL